MIDEKRVDRASRMAGRWLARSCQVTDTDDPNLGAFATVYRPEEGKFAVGSLPHETSEAVRALLRLYGRTRNESWKDSAILGGRYLESIQCEEDAGEECGSLWKHWLNGSEALSVDSNYRSIVGLLDLYGATGATHYLDSAKGIADWFENRAYRGGTHLNRFFPDKKVLGWPRSHILDEGGFLRLHDLTREERYTKIFEDQIEALLSSSMDDGTFSCMDTPRMEKDPAAAQGELSTRDMYWHLVPIIMAEEKRGDDRLMGALLRGADLLMRQQDEEGYLPRSFLKVGDLGKRDPDGVATGMVALLWLKLYPLTGKETYLAHGEAALEWMLSSQFVSRRESYLGGFFEENHIEGPGSGGIPGAMASSYGIMACEEYLRSIKR